MVSRNFHSKYAKCVRTFCKSLPSALQVTTDEIDTYFRSCAQYLWSQSTQPNDIFDGINRLYTDSQVKLTCQEFEDQINFYRANPGETVGVPDFFLRMLEFDKDSGTDNSRKFTDVQDKVLTICMEYIQNLTDLDMRRKDWICERFIIICDQAAIGLDGNREELDRIEWEALEKDAQEKVSEALASLHDIFQASDE